MFSSMNVISLYDHERILLKSHVQKSVGCEKTAFPSLVILSNHEGTVRVSSSLHTRFRKDPPQDISRNRTAAMHVKYVTSIYAADDTFHLPAQASSSPTTIGSYQICPYTGPSTQVKVNIAQCPIFVVILICDLGSINLETPTPREESELWSTLYKYH